jgi:hypothetical protein
VDHNSQHANHRRTRFAFAKRRRPGRSARFLRSWNRHTWTATGPFPNDTHIIGPSTTTLLNTGNVLLTGFRSTYNDTPTLSETVLYNFATNAYTVGASMNSTRWANAATLLPNGQVLVSGGYRHGVGIGTVPLSSAELYTP